jgi:SAM-dependent methyltransferase
MSPSPAEKHLCFQLERSLKEAKSNNTNPARILNIGAGHSLSIEQYLTDSRCDFICDRIDVVDCTVVHHSVEKCWQCSVESMTPVDSNKYNAAFSNYVLEYIPDLHKAAQEVYRTLKPSGKFISSIPNVNSPEVYISKITPMWLRYKLRRYDRVYQPLYKYTSINELINIFESAGFHTLEVKYFPHIELYLKRWSSFFGKLGNIYDRTVSSFNINNLMGSTCIMFEKAVH